jgi:asparagine synthase (glutamine-hydrolysing)
LLPDEVLVRRSKASFDGAFWHEDSRRLAAEWHGDGVDAELVNPAALAAEWRRERPDPRTLTLLQAVWLARNARSAGEAVEQPLAGVAE